MASTDETLRIGVELELRKLREGLAELPDITDKEARDMVRALQKQYRRAEKEAERLRKSTGREIGKIGDSAKDTAERVASLFGGAFGDVSDSVLDLGGRVVGLSGEIGGVAGAFTLAAGGAAALTLAAGFGASAFLGWLDTSEELRESLEDVSGLPPLDPAHEAALDGYAEAGRDASAVMTHHALQLQAEFMPAATEAKHAVIGLAAELSDLAGGQGAISQGYEDFRDIMGYVNPAVGLWNAHLAEAAERGQVIAETITHATAEQDELTAAFEASRREIGNTMDEYEAMAEALGLPISRVEDLDRANERAHRDAQRRREQERAEMERMWAVAERAEAKFQADKIKAAEKEAEVQGERLEKWDEEIAKLYEAGAAWQAMSADATAYAELMEERLVEAQLAVMGQIAGEGAALAEQAAQVKIDALSREADALDRVHRKELRALDVRRDEIEAALEAGRMSKSAAEAELARIDEEEKASKELARAKRRDLRAALRDAHAASQAAARARATIDALANAVALTAAFAPLGPGAPAAAAGVAMGQLAIQLAAIDNTPPPRFATGGMVGRAGPSAGGGEVMVRAEPDEALLSPRGVRNAGGPAGVERLNTGRPGGRDVVDLSANTLAAIRAMLPSSLGVSQAVSQLTGALPGVRTR